RGAHRAVRAAARRGLGTGGDVLRLRRYALALPEQVGVVEVPGVGPGAAAQRHGAGSAAAGGGGAPAGGGGGGGGAGGGGWGGWGPLSRTVPALAGGGERPPAGAAEHGAEPGGRAVGDVEERQRVSPGVGRRGGRRGGRAGVGGGRGSRIAWAAEFRNRRWAA